MVACAVAALVLLVVLMCECGAGCEQCCAAMGGGGEEAAARSPRSPPRTSRSFRSTRSSPSTRHRHPCAELRETLPLPLPLPLTPNNTHVDGAAVVQAEHDLWRAVEAGDEVRRDLVVVAVGRGAEVTPL